MPSPIVLASQFVCPAPVKLWGWITLPWICGGICNMDDGKTLVCPKCGLKRDYQRRKFVA